MTISIIRYKEVNFYLYFMIDKTKVVKRNILYRIFFFYYDGFRNMTVGKKLWIIILIKLFVLFVILKLLFFPNILKKEFETDQERGEYVIDQLSKTQ